MANQQDFVIYKKGQSDNDNDIWDDSALIKAYDAAVSSMKKRMGGDEQEEVFHVSDKYDTSAKQPMQKKSKHKKRKKKSREWHVGDSCQAVYSEDGLLYGAIILSINAEEKTCFVRYIDYGDEEQHNLPDLLPMSRKKGRHVSDLELDSVTDSGAERSASITRHPRQSPKHKVTNQNPAFGPSWPWPLPFMGANPSMQAPAAASMPPPAPPPFTVPWGSPACLPGWPQAHNPGMMPNIPPPPPPLMADSDGDNEALCSMLMSWYMSGYHTGYYQGLKQSKKHPNGPR